jgi:Tol biopolymer transport system component
MLTLLCFVTATARPAMASFPGRNGSIAFTGEGDGFAGPCALSTCIKIISPNGGVESTFNLTSGANHAHYSPDGKALAFDRDVRGRCCQIYTVRANGTHLRRITHGFDDESPAWSPDGRQIVFSRRRKSGTEQLYVVNADGTNLHSLTKGAVGGSGPDWSTTGLVAFQGSSSSGNDIFVVNADGTGETDLTNGAPAGCSAPSWSPDGRWIAFIAGGNVWRMRADGTQKTRLTKTPSINEQPAFSPDGTRIVYQDDMTGLSELWVMHADGSRPRQLTRDPVSDSAPNWQPRS